MSRAVWSARVSGMFVLGFRFGNDYHSENQNNRRESYYGTAKEINNGTSFRTIMEERE